MTTFLFLLTLIMQGENSEQLSAYAEVFTSSSNALFAEPPVAVSWELFPKSLLVGDMLYATVTTKNITRIPIEYQFVPNRIGYDPFLMSATLAKSNSTEFAPGGFDRIVIYEVPGGIGDGPTPPRLPSKTLQPGGLLSSGPQSVLIPPPSNYDRQFWAWRDLGKKERMMLRLGTLLVCSSSETSRKESHNVQLFQELIIKQRPKEELQLIKDWYEKTGKFENLWKADSPTAKQWQEFEEKLTPGTLRNYIRVNRTLVEIAQDENKGKRQEQFNEMLKWLDKLHPLEKEGLTKRTYEIVRKNANKFDSEIAVPAVVP